MSSKASSKRRQTPVPPTAQLVQNQVGAGTLDKFIPLLIVLAGIVAYYNSLHAPFIFDDRYHILENARIRQLWPPWSFLAHSSRPVVYLSLALNYAFGELSPLGYHIFNVTVHIIAALLLYGVLRRTFLSTPLKEKWSSAATGLAALIATIWLVHPIQTESVTYTIQRGESLMGMFYLLTLYCVIRSAESSQGILWKAAAVASCLLGMGTKGGIMVTAPLLVLLYDRVFLTRSWNEIARQRWGLYAGLAATWMSYPLMLAAAPEEWKDSAGFAYAGATPMQYAMTQAKVILHYLQLSLWPDQLCLDYGWPVARGAGDIVPYLIVIAGLAIATVWAWRKKPAAGFLGAWFFIILIPTSSFIPIADIAVEHRMYLSLAALITLIVAGLYSFSRRNATGQSSFGKFGWIAGAAVVLLLTALTIQRNGDYASKLSIWQDTVVKSPHNPRAQYDLGVALEETDNVQDAIVHYRDAVQENPNYADALTNLGHLLLVTGHAEDSVVYLKKALDVKPDLAATHNNLALALAQQGKTQEAVAHWKQALQFKPDFAEPHNNLGIVAAQEGRNQDAIAEWEQAIKLDPKLADAHNNLAYLLSQKGMNREAIAHYQQALAIKPAYFQAQINLAKLLATVDVQQGGDPARAATLAQHACELPGHRDAACLDILATSYAAANRLDDAVRAEQSALDLARSAGDSQLAQLLAARMETYRERLAKHVALGTPGSGKP